MNDSRDNNRPLLQSQLDRHGIEATVIDIGTPMHTADLASQRLGIPVGGIFKSIVLVSEKGLPLLAVLPGDKRVNLKRLSSLAGCKSLRFAKPDVVLEVTGFPAGGTPPVGHAQALPVFVDRGILGYFEGYGGGGSAELLLRIRPEELIRATQATVADIAD
jgi:Cys-tRNA(Pro) deacylase